LVRSLEERIAPATFTVTNTGDTGTGSGTSGDLRYCMNQAGAIVGSTNTIDLTGVSGTIALTSALPTIAGPMTMTGPGAGLLTIAGVGILTYVITSAPGSSGTTTISGLSIASGQYGIEVGSGNLGLSGLSIHGNGVGVYDAAAEGTQATITNSTISGNFDGINDRNGANVTITGSSISDNTDQGMYFHAGNNTALTIVSSTISGNGDASSSHGGGLCCLTYHGGPIHISNSMIANNRGIDGGGIEFYGYGLQATLTNDTIAANTATNSDPLPGDGGGGIVMDVSPFFGTDSINLALDNTVIAGNVSTNGFSDISAGAAPNPNTPYAIQAQYSAIGTATGFPLTDLGQNLIGVPLLLGPLGNNGGPTQTVPLLAASPAIGVGDPAQNGTADQRGIMRPQQMGPNPRPDIGAYERTANTLSESAAVSNVTASTAPAVYQFTVTYADNVPITVSSIDANDVTVTPPAGVPAVTVSLAGVNTTNPNKVVATYQFTAPGGAWTAADNGTYTVTMAANQVTDANGAVPAGPMASFVMSFTTLFKVNDTLDDTNPGSLRYAITQANSIAPNPAVIEFSNSTATGATDFYDGTLHTITLAATLPNIVNTLTIIGPGSNVLKISPAAGGAYPLFLLNSVAYYNAQTFAVGLSGMTLSGAQTTNNGGAIDQPDSAALTLTDVSIGGNSAGFDGGAIYGGGALTLANCKIVGNTAGRYGGGIEWFGQLSATDCVVTANLAAGQGGGMSAGNVALTRCTVADNSAGGSGGGLRASGLTIDRSTISGNTSASSTVGGGGIFLYGSIGPSGDLIVNSTIANNRALNGGGLAAQLFGNLTIRSSTITGNVATTTSTATGRGGGGLDLYSIFNPAPWPVPPFPNTYGRFTLDNTIVSGNQANNMQRHEIASVRSIRATYSAIGQSSGFTNLGNNVYPVTPAELQLGSLGSFGGTTRTIPVGASGAATHTGDPALAGTTDQRGILRPQGAGVTIGAFEPVAGVPTAIAQTQPVLSPAVPAVYQFTVTYGDATAIQYSTVNGNNNAVTVMPPSGLPPVAVTLVGTDQSGDSNEITATYQFTVPGGAWTPVDDGIWTVNMAANQVKNTANVFVPGGPISTFRASVPTPVALAVTTTADSGPGSLRDALTQANSPAPRHLRRDRLQQLDNERGDQLLRRGAAHDQLDLRPAGHFQPGDYYGPRVRAVDRGAVGLRPVVRHLRDQRL
jgi:hypothetical protein